MKIDIDNQGGIWESEGMKNRQLAKLVENTQTPNGADWKITKRTIMSGPIEVVERRHLARKMARHNKPLPDGVVCIWDDVILTQY